eukprot:7420338-Pyramimonas_sp.AAC.1
MSSFYGSPVPTTARVHSTPQHDGDIYPSRERADLSSREADLPPRARAGSHLCPLADGQLGDAEGGRVHLLNVTHHLVGDPLRLLGQQLDRPLEAKEPAAPRRENRPIVSGSAAPAPRSRRRAVLPGKRTTLPANRFGE